MNESDGRLDATPLPELTTEFTPSLEHGAATIPTPRPQSLMIVLSADDLAAAIAKAHKVKIDPSEFALRSAKLILDLLPPLYYEPRKEK